MFLKKINISTYIMLFLIVLMSVFVLYSDLITLNWHPGYTGFHMLGVSGNMLKMPLFYGVFCFYNIKVSNDILEGISITSIYIFVLYFVSHVIRVLRILIISDNSNVR